MQNTIGVTSMEYVVAVLILAAFGYFIYTRVKAKPPTSGTGGGIVRPPSGGGRGEDMEDK